MTVSLPNAINIGEGEGMVVVCATLSATEDTERSFTITLATEDDTGDLLSMYIEHMMILCDFCRKKCF